MRWAPTGASRSRVLVVARAIVMKPPDRPAWRPEKESSKTKEVAGSPPPRAQAFRKTSGSGLPLVTSSLATAPAKKWPMPKSSNDSARFSLCVEAW